MFRFNIQRFLNSFRFAFRGLRFIFKEEQSFLFQLIAALLIIFLMFYFKLTSLEKVALIIVITLVLVLEVINTVIERILNLMEPNFNILVGKIKDMISAIVLFVSLAAVVIGFLIFYPYLIKFLR